MSKSSTNEKKSEQPSAGRVIRVAWRYMGGGHHLFVLSGLMLALEAATAVIIPLVIAFVINYLTARLAQIDGKPVLPPASPLNMVGLPTFISPDIDTLLIVTIGILVLTMVNSLGDSLSEIYLARGGRRLGYNVRVALYSHLQKLSLSFHDQRRTGDILTRVTGDVAALEDFVVESLSDFVGSLLLIAFILIAMVANAWQVALVAAVIIPVMALVSNYYTRRIKAASKKWRTSEGELTTSTQEMLTSIRVIQTYGLGSFEQSIFNEQSKKAMDAALEAANLEAQFSWIVSVLGALSTSAVIWMAVWLIFHTPASLVGIGLLTAYVKYIQDMFKPTKRIIQEWNAFGKLTVRVERIADLLDLKPEVEDLPGAVAAPQFKGQVEFRNVSFSYRPVSADGNGTKLAPRNALKNIDLKIEPGQVVAVVGHTGAGKSTILQLLPRLYDATSGQVLIDGQDIRQFTLDSLRSQISMVLQESILFSGSIVENIAYGRPDATGAEIIAAAKQANAHEFIEKLPDGYYTMLGERGSNLSGGQRQRIAIARAFVRHTSILLLDEPTTGLDAESSELVLKALRTLMMGKTTIIISHDLNLIRDADQIIVIKAGEIEQMGTHEELLQAGGLYANLYQKQSGQPLPSSAASEVSLPALAAGQKGQDAAQKLWYFDLPHFPAIQDRLPALSQAYDAQFMSARLQDAFFGQSENSLRIESCKPGKAVFLPDNQCILHYTLEVKDTVSSEVISYVINARLFPLLSDCESYLRQYLLPLADQLRSRSEFASWITPVAMLEDLKIAASVFPIDGNLPTLISATDKDRMLKVFNETLPEVLSGGLILENLRFELANYKRFKRCSLRYTLNGRQLDTGQTQTQVVYGKLDADSYGGITVPVIAALRERVHNNGNPFYYKIPRSLAYLPDLKLLLTETFPGNQSIKQLVAQKLNGDTSPTPGSLTLEEAIQACAWIAASLHGSEIKLGRRRLITDEIECLQEDIEPLQQILPDLGNQLHSCLDEISTYAKVSPPLPLRFCHGHFRSTQLNFDGRDCWLTDYETVCQAEPALDLGQFLAYQHLAIQEGNTPDANLKAKLNDDLCELFLTSYIHAAHDWLGDPEALRSRVSIYENISLVRLAVSNWQKLKGPRLKYTVDLLEQSMACLA